MCSYLTEILRPNPPQWLEVICHRLKSNDPNLECIELPRILDDVFTHELARCIEENHTARSLTMSFFSIVDDGACTMATALSKNHFIKKLQVRDMRNQREINLFFQNLKSNKNLKEISMRHCSICPNGVESIGLFFGSHPSVKEIRLVDTTVVDMAFTALAKLLPQCSSLHRLYFINNDLNPKDIESLGILLSDIESLFEELYLCENDVGDNEMCALAGGINRNKTIKLLDLRSNRISGMGAVSIQGILISNPNLSKLHLANNELGNVGVAALCRALQSSSSRLQSLNVAGNGCDSKTAFAIAEMLKHNKSLTALNLSFNDLGDKGALAIARSLEKNTSVQRLELRKVGMSYTGARSFGDSLPYVMVLKELILTNNPIGMKGSSSLLEGLRDNFVLEYLLVDEKMQGAIPSEISYLLRLNKAGRKVFRQDNKVEVSLWPAILSHISKDPNILHYFIREKPEILAAMFPADMV